MVFDTQEDAQLKIVTTQNEVPQTKSYKVPLNFSISNNDTSTFNQHSNFWIEYERSIKNEMLMDIRDYLACPIIFFTISLIILFIWVIILTIYMR